VKTGFQELGVVLHSFYIQLLQLFLFLVLVGKFDNSQTFSPDWHEISLIRVK